MNEARTQLLGLPSRLKQRHPEIAREHVAAVDELIREALERLADSRGGTHDDTA